MIIKQINQAIMVNLRLLRARRADAPQLMT